MTEESDNFEIFISRIHELLEKEGSLVQWNEKIPDPDNPSQLRQIDVTVRNDDVFNIIECRLHRNKQNVKWIEELMGRRASLRADSAIAVSSSGFTAGAVRKAKTFGVVLRDLTHLPEEEILSWTKGINIQLNFYRYSDFKLKIFISDTEFDGLNIEQLKHDLQRFIGFNTIFTAHLETLEKQVSLPQLKEREKPVKFSLEFSIDDFVLDGRTVQSLKTSGEMYLEEVQLSIPEHLAYGEPEESGESRNVYIQNYNLGDTKIIHHGENISVSIDLSKLEIPPYWQFRHVELHGGGLHNNQAFELVGVDKLIMKKDFINLTVESCAHNE